MTTPENRKRDIVRACQILDAKGLTEAFGHVSARHPSENAILITSIDGMGLIEVDDILTVDFEGEVLEGDPTLRPIEVYLHLSIYNQRQDIKAISRTHGQHVSTFGVTEEPLRPIHGFGGFLGDKVPVHSQSRLIESYELGGEVAETLSGHHAVILRGNGECTIGKSISKACVKSLYLEESARLHVAARQIGEPRVFAEEERKIRNEHREEEFKRAWEFYTRKLTDV